MLDHLKQPAARIQALQAEGVQVAMGDGKWWQRVVVLITQILSILCLSYFAYNDLTILVALPLVCVIIDFLSGMVHWFFDNQIRPGPTLLGRIAIDFLDHHVHPNRTTEVGFFVSAYRPALLVSMPIIIASIWASSTPLTQGCVFWVGVLSLYVPQTHKLAHASEQRVNWTTQVMQRSRLILNPGSHDGHHQNNNISYCVFTGWLNWPLNRLGFWRFLDRLFPPYAPLA